jgi:hypothetical protein
MAIAAIRAQQGRSPDRTYQPVGWGSEATLELRDDGPDGLLFAPGIWILQPPVNAERHGAYRLSWASLELIPSTQTAWSSASGSVEQCDRAGLTPRSTLREVDGALFISGHPIATRGQVRHVRLSPNGQLAAVLSASGIRAPDFSPMPALGGGGIVGWRFHQFVTASGGEASTPSIGLGFGVSDPIPCWTPDGRAVVYADPAFTDVSLVLAPR